MTSAFHQRQTIATSAADPVQAIMSSFRRGSALVDRAVASLVVIAAVLETIETEDERARGRVMKDLRAAIETASLEGDNLLVARQGRAEAPFVIFTLSRQKTGAFAIQPVEIDRRALALAAADGGTEPGPLDRLAEVLEARTCGAGHGPAQDVQTAVRTVAQAAASALSRLSIAKARLDLQSTFLTAILDAETASPLVRLDSHLNHAGARDMAMATRRMLGRQSLNIANSNRRTLEALLQPHLSSLA